MLSTTRRQRKPALATLGSGRGPERVGAAPWPVLASQGGAVGAQSPSRRSTNMMSQKPARTRHAGPDAPSTIWTEAVGITCRAFCSCRDVMAARTGPTPTTTRAATIELRRRMAASDVAVINACDTVSSSCDRLRSGLTATGSRDLPQEWQRGRGRPASIRAVLEACGVAGLPLRRRPGLPASPSNCPMQATACPPSQTGRRCVPRPRGRLARNRMTHGRGRDRAARRRGPIVDRAGRLRRRLARRVRLTAARSTLLRGRSCSCRRRGARGR